MATTSNATEVVKVDCSVGKQQLQSDFVELRMADSGVVQSVEGVVDNLGAGGPGCKSFKKLDCNLYPCSLKADGVDPNIHIKVDERDPYLHEKLEKAFNDMKIWLAGCSAAERVI